MFDYLRGFSNGKLAREDINMINSRLIDDNERNGGNIYLPKKIIWTCITYVQYIQKEILPIQVYSTIMLM